jgi:hypothetical protein
MVVESAWISEDAAREAGLLAVYGANAVPESDAFSSMDAGGVTAASSYEHQGFIRGHTTDPPGIYVAKTYSHEQWSWTGSCATGENRWSQFGWFGWWYLFSNSTDWYGSCLPGIETYGLYKNPKFCLSIDTWAEHTVNFKATGDPASWASWSLRKWGGCSWLLSSGTWYDPY